MVYKTGSSDLSSVLSLVKSKEEVPSDNEMKNEQAVFYLDVGGLVMRVKVKDSDGTIRTGLVANLV